MKIYFTIFYVVGVLVIKNSVSGKSLIFSKYSNGPQFDAHKQNDIAFDESKENLEKDKVEALINSYKRSADLDNNFKPLKRSIFDGPLRKRSPYGLVYNQGKPIGILEPIAQSFEYSNYGPRDVSCRNGLYKSQWFPVKRESELDMDEFEKDQRESLAAGLHSSNYANVLAKFKVNNKVKHRPYQDYLNSQTKRATADVNRRKEIDDLKKRGALDMGDLKKNLKKKIREMSVTDKLTNKADTSKVDEIEENLKDVMGDMGLVEKDKEAQTSQVNDGSVKKREIYFEDEDLENGLNKIGLTKESHSDRNKKEDCPGKTKVAKSKGSRKIGVDKGLHKKGKKKARKDDESNSKRSILANRKRIAEKKDVGSGDMKMKVANYQYEGEEFIRKKRQEKQAAEKTEDSDIMKGLETSGDLTVSGNKSPLAAVSNTDETDVKKSEEKRDKEELDYEKRLERNIQAKINAIKEEVKREIGKIKTDDTQKDQQRKKRDITNTLLDEETSILDPGINIDHKLEPHIRKRRDLPKEMNVAAEESREKRESKKENDVANKSNVKTNADTKKTVREANKTPAKPVASTQENQANKKVKRSDASAGEIKKTAEGETKSAITDQPLKKRDDKLAKEEKNTATDVKEGASKHLTKRNSEESVTKIDAFADDSLNAKNIEKRDDAFIATDKIETDNKAEFGTDAPESIVKRSDQTAAPINTNEADLYTIMSEEANIVKRNEKESESATTDKSFDNTMAPKNMDAGLENGQTLVNLDSDNEAREERQLTKAKTNAEADVVTTAELSETKKEQEENREERGASYNKQSKAQKLDKATTNHKALRRDIESDEIENDLIKPSLGETNSASDDKEGEHLELRGSERNDPAISEEAKDNIKQRDVQKESHELSDDTAVEERSADTQKTDADISEDGINERSAYGKQNISSVYADAELNDDIERDARKAAATKSAKNFQELNSEDTSLNDEINDQIAIEKRRRRRNANSRHGKRRKRDESLYSENRGELNNYRADNDGEIDDEDDEMHDDGFDDQTSNFMSKRNADYDHENIETNADQEANEDYPMYQGRNKRNTLRIYDDENDAEESYDNNFLFYPNKYSRAKRHNYEDLAAFHGGGMTNHAAAHRERNKQSYEQNLRRKRLEKLNKLHDDNENVAELSESDIFGGFPQSYEGELSRFKRVKRSYLQ